MTHLTTQALERPTHAEIEAMCRYAFQREDGYGTAPESDPRYRAFRDGFYAGYLLNFEARPAQ